MNTLTSPRANIVNLAPKDFVQLPDSPPLIDVRTEIEYQQFHAPEALNLSLHRLLLGQIPLLRHWLLPQWFQNCDQTAPIAVICLTAHRSPIAAQHLAKLGFQQVFNLTGGMMAWRTAGLPISSGKPQPQ